MELLEAAKHRKARLQDLGLVVQGAGKSESQPLNASHHAAQVGGQPHADVFGTTAIQWSGQGEHAGRIGRVHFHRDQQVTPGHRFAHDLSNCAGADAAITRANSPDQAATPLGPG
jgi:hypothetical protein